MQDKTISIKLNDILDDPLNLEETCRKIIRFALEVSKADYCTLTIINPIDKRIIRVYIQNNETMQEIVSIEKDKISLKEIDQKALDKNDAISIDINTENSGYYSNVFSTSEQIKSLIALKLLAPRSECPKTLGQLYLGYKKKCRDITLEKEIGKTIAKEVSSALQHTWSLRRYKDVAEIGQEINKELKSPKQIFEKLTQHLPKILDSSYFFMMVVYDQRANNLNFYILENGKEKKIKKKPDGACAYVLNKQEPLTILNYEVERPELEKKEIYIVHFIAERYRNCGLKTELS